MLQVLIFPGTNRPWRTVSRSFISKFLESEAKQQGFPNRSEACKNSYIYLAIIEWGFEKRREVECLQNNCLLLGSFHMWIKSQWHFVFASPWFFSPFSWVLSLTWRKWWYNLQYTIINVCGVTDDTDGILSQHFPNLVSASWLRRINGEITANQNGEIFWMNNKICIVKLTLISTQNCSVSSIRIYQNE